MLILPQAAQISIQFLNENQWCCTSLRDLFKNTLLRDRKRRKKAQQLAGIEPKTSRVLLRRCVLCSTAVLQPLPNT